MEYFHNHNCMCFDEKYVISVKVKSKIVIYCFNAIKKLCNITRLRTTSWNESSIMGVVQVIVM